MAKKPKTRKRQRSSRDVRQRAIKKDDIEELADFVEDNGELPSLARLERTFPGISTSSAARKEVMMALVFQFNLRGYKTGQIAAFLGLSISSISNYRREIEKQFEHEMLRFSMLAHVGRSIRTYREFQAQSAKLVYDKKVKPTPKIMAINSAVNAEDRINMLLKELGAFRAVQYSPNLTATDSSDEMMQMRSFASIALSGNEELADMFLEQLDSDESGSTFEEKDVKLLS